MGFHITIQFNEVFPFVESIPLNLFFFSCFGQTDLILPLYLPGEGVIASVAGCSFLIRCHFYWWFSWVMTYLVIDTLLILLEWSGSDWK